MAAGEAIGEVAIAQEPAGNFGSLTAGLPDDGLNTYRAMECWRRASLAVGKSPALALDSQRSGPHSRPDEMDSIWSGGAVYQRRTGSITLKVPVRGLVPGGTGIYTGYGTGGTPHPLGLILNSGFQGFAPVDDVDPAAANVSPNRFTSTVIGDYTLGQLLGVELAGLRRYTALTEIVGADVIHSPALTITLEDVYPMYTWGPAVAGLGTLGRSISMRFRRLHPTAGGRQSYAYGGRLAKVTFAPDGERRHLMAEVEIQFAFINDEGTTVPGEPVIDEGASVANALGSEVCVSAALPQPFLGGVGIQLARTTLQCGADWSFTVENTLVGVDTMGAGPLAVAEWEVANSIATWKGKVTPTTILDSMLRTRERRQLLVGCGPARPGSGWCGYIGAAHLTEDSLLDDSGPRLVQPVSMTGDYYDGDDTRVAPAGLPWRFGVPVI